MPKKRTGNNPLAYTGVRAPQPPNIVFEDRAPTTNDYIGFALGDLWVYRRDANSTPPEAPKTNDVYMIVSKDKRIAKATWISLGGGDVETITGDIGGAVGPDNNLNINLLGGDDIQVTGDPNTNTLTINSTSTGDIETLTGDTGGAIPSDNNNNINILGGNDVQVNGAGNTLTIESTSLDIETLTGNAGGAVAPSAGGNIDVVGNNGITVTGTPASNNLTITTSAIRTATGNAGGAIAPSSGGNIGIVGNNGITVTGTPASNNLTITTNAIRTLTGNSGGARPPASNGNFNIVGSGGISVAGSGNTLTVNSHAGTSAFEARMTTDKNNVTGAGTIYKLQWDVTDSNIGNNFSLTNNEYTVPTTGVYQFNCCVSVGNITSSMKSMAISMRFSGVTRALTHENPYAVLSDSGIVRRNCNISRHLTAGTKVSVVIGISGGSSNTAQVWSGESTGVTRVRTWFTGFRVS